MHLRDCHNKKYPQHNKENDTLPGWSWLPGYGYVALGNLVFTDF